MHVLLTQQIEDASNYCLLASNAKAYGYLHFGLKCAADLEEIGTPLGHPTSKS